MNGDRLQRRNEFEKAFLLWKATKDEERKVHWYMFCELAPPHSQGYLLSQVAIAAKKKAEEEEEIRLERKRVAGLMAYEKWKAVKLREHEDKLEERRQLLVHKRLENAANEGKIQQAQAAYRNWKERKKREEVDRKMRNKATADNQRQTGARIYQQLTVLAPWSLSAWCLVVTPSLPGYCSVWECDKTLAQKMLQVCPRQAHQSSIGSRDWTTNTS